MGPIQKQDRWQRKTQLATGAGALKGKLQAFNQVRLVDHPSVLDC